MSKQENAYKEIISPEIIQLYAECVGVQDKLSYEVANLEREIEELRRQKNEQKKKYNEIREAVHNIAEFEKAQNLTIRKETIPFVICFSFCIASLFSTLCSLCMVAEKMIKIWPLLVSAPAFIISCYGVKFTQDTPSFWTEFLYKYDKKYKKFKDIYDSYNKQIKQEWQTYRDLRDTVSAKEKELEAKKAELKKIEEACNHMEKKINRVAILEGAVALGANPEILKVAQSIREHMVPDELTVNQQSLEEGKGQFTLTTPTI